MSHDAHLEVSGDQEDPTPGPLWVVGVAGAVLTLVTVLGVTSIYYAAERAEVDHKVMSVRSGSKRWRKRSTAGLPTLFQTRSRSALDAAPSIPMRKAE